MIDPFPPSFFMFIAAAIIPLIPHGTFRNIFLLGAPIFAGAVVLSLPHGNGAEIQLAGLTLEMMRVDKLSVVFAALFCLAAFLANLYALHLKDTLQQVAALAYAGSAIGAVFAGDLVTLFLYWEGTAITSVFLIWARGSEGAFHTGMRYLIIQIASGVILLAGVVIFYSDTGSIAFDQMELGSIASWLMLLAFGIKCAFPFLHGWVKDAYPAATVTGTVILSAFTTKLAIYALARGFPGTELLIYIGATMALFPIFFAIAENDLRRVLAYALISQLGFMVVGVGVGTELSLNGTVAHAFASVLYKSLLFMSVGAVLYRTGTSKVSDLGGLYRTMPWTMVLCLIGGASIAAFPLFSGFVTKSLILSGAAKEGYSIVWAILLFASASVLVYVSLRIPFSIFFSGDSGLRPQEAPRHMIWAMGLAAFLCVAIGVYPAPLYAILPFEVSYESYTTSHVMTQLQLLAFAALAFAVLVKKEIYQKSQASINLDFDLVYRRIFPSIIGALGSIIARFWDAKLNFATAKINQIITGLYRSHGPEGRMASAWPTGSMVLWIAILLSATLLVNFL